MNWITVCLLEKLGWAKLIKTPELKVSGAELKQPA
jgi:hypothetical protein